MRQDEIFYDARNTFYDLLGVVTSARPTFETTDPRVARNLAEEWHYLKSGYRLYKENIEAALFADENVFDFQFRLVKESLPIRYVSSTHLNTDLFDVPNELDWNNAGREKPLIFWQYLNFNGQTYLSSCVLQKHSQIASKFFSQLDSLLPHVRLAHFFRYASANNFGFAMNPEAFESYSNEGSFVSDIEKYTEAIRERRRLFSWRRYVVPSDLGTMTWA